MGGGGSKGKERKSAKKGKRECVTEGGVGEGGLRFDKVERLNVSGSLNRERSSEY